MTKSMDNRIRATLAMLAGGLAALTISGGIAEAAVCGERDKMQRVLVDKYKESTRGLGVVSERGVVELYTSASGTWSILLTTSAGASCIIATGSHWQELAQVPDGPEA